MKAIENLTVQCTFTVGLCDLEVTDEVYDGLSGIYDSGEIDSDDHNKLANKNTLQAFEWLSDKIDFGDAYEWSYEINDMDDENN